MRSSQEKPDMLIKKPNDIPSSEITPNRRISTGGSSSSARQRPEQRIGGGLIFEAATQMQDTLRPAEPSSRDRQKGPFSTTEKAQTLSKTSPMYNNYYEFSTDKYEPNGLAQSFRTRPWTVKIDGLVKKSKTLGHRLHPEAGAARGAQSTVTAVWKAGPW